MRVEQEQEIIQAHRTYTQRLTEVLVSVHRGELTTEEAAKSLAGVRLKSLESMGQSLSPDAKASLERQELLAIESRLPGWKGLVLDRHIRD